jgi:hypothetical protein
METQIVVKDEQEALMIQTGLQDPDLRVFLQICALLKTVVEEKDDVHNTKRKMVLHAVCCLYGCEK